MVSIMVDGYASLLSSEWRHTSTFRFVSMREVAVDSIAHPKGGEQQWEEIKRLKFLFRFTKTIVSGVPTVRKCLRHMTTIWISGASLIVLRLRSYANSRRNADG